MAATEKAVKVKELISDFLYRSNDQENQDCVEHHKESEATLPSKPRNKDAFVKRVESFTTLTWYAKPSAASPLECARYGWMNVESDLLRCVSCKAVVSGQLPKNTLTEAYAESCKKLETSIKSSHKTICPWPHNPSPESFGTIPLHDRDIVLADYRERFSSLQMLSDKLPQVSCDQLSNNSLLCSGLVRSATDINMDLSSDTNTKTLHAMSILAVTGWTYCPKSKDILQCLYCQRKVGLWNFNQMLESRDASVTSSQGGEVDSNVDSDVVSPSKKQKRTKGSFCPVEEHKSWCPWLSAQLPSEGQSDTRPTWKQLVDKLTQDQTKVSSPVGVPRTVGCFCNSIAEYLPSDKWQQMHTCTISDKLNSACYPV